MSNKSYKKPTNKLKPIEIGSLKELSPDQSEELLAKLEERFHNNITRHQDIEWSDLCAKIVTKKEKLWSLHAMEKTGGEPDVVGQDEKTGEYIFIDCSKESPIGRRNTCYDRQAQDAREKKGIFPAGNVVDIAISMGIEVLTEEQYRGLQKLGSFDTKTSSWIETPLKIRKLGGALFADRRYDTVFVYHNSAPSFYSARGFRGSIKI